MIVITESRAAASARTQRVGSFRGKNTFIIGEAIITSLGWVPLGMKASILAQWNDVADMLVAEDTPAPNQNR